MSKKRFTTRMVSLKTHGIKSMEMSGTDSLVYYSISAPWPEFALNRNLYKVVHLRAERTLAVAPTIKAAREIISRLDDLSINWNSAFTPNSVESARLLALQKTFALEGLHYDGSWE